MTAFELVSDYRPMGDQPNAIRDLTVGLDQGLKHQVLLGATGTGKTFTVANVIAKVQRPTLVLVHNKTLAAQLYQEFSSFFPNNAVAYFVSYYDYYRPEAYVPSSDTYIEKTTLINDEIERMRLAATHALATRRDVIIVASVSAIYALGNPARYNQAFVDFEIGSMRQRDKVLRKLVGIYYERNDYDLQRSHFRVRGDTLEVWPAYTDTAYRVEFWGNVIERITEFDPTTGEVIQYPTEASIYPARHFVPPEDRYDEILREIELDLDAQLANFQKQDKLLEAQRLSQRTRYDMEMIHELGFCNGAENYTRYFYGREAGASPWTLLDYFPDDFLMVIDESHITLPQIRSMYKGNLSRKQTLIDYGFRLPSCLDNRPLTFEEWEARAYQVIYTSATPGPYEHRNSEQTSEQIIRPTGLLDPEIDIRPIAGQVDDLIHEINLRVKQGQRVLVTTLTKRMAESLSEYLEELDIKVQYLHSDVDTLERVDILQDLRLGNYDVLVGINLLREGLDLPEVSLVAILDADKEGFLRSDTALIQNIGRAARHVQGRVIMYADRITDSMQRAITETNRRRDKQVTYNQAHDIEAKSVVKEIKAMLPVTNKRDQRANLEQAGDDLPLPQIQLEQIQTLEAEMKAAAANLEFEKAARLRDEMAALRVQVDVVMG